MNETSSPVKAAGLVIKENVPLAPLTTLEVGGAARFFVEANTESDAAQAVNWAKSNEIPLFVLGGGSNVLISDEGFNGLVLKINLKGIKADENANDVLVTAQAGEDWDRFVRFCVEKNLAGVECLSGIPGTVGGTPVQNVGAYGQEVSETIAAVRVLNRAVGEISEMTNRECGFSYRKSVFNTSRKDEFIVLAVTFRLKSGGAAKIVYKDLREHFGERDPSLAETRAAVLDIRRAKSMVWDATDSNSKSAGSFFKNPIVLNEKLAEIARQLDSEDVPAFKTDADRVKIPAAWLIEKAGFGKGFKYGRAGISSNHTLAIVNLGDARANDILSLKNLIQTKVKAIFGIDLHPEPVFVGCVDESVSDRTADGKEQVKVD